MPVTRRLPLLADDSLPTTVPRGIPVAGVPSACLGVPPTIPPGREARAAPVPPDLPWPVLPAPWPVPGGTPIMPGRPPVCPAPGLPPRTGSPTGPPRALFTGPDLPGGGVFGPLPPVVGGRTPGRPEIGGVPEVRPVIGGGVCILLSAGGTMGGVGPWRAGGALPTGSVCGPVCGRRFSVTGGAALSISVPTWESGRPDAPGRGTAPRFGCPVESPEDSTLAGAPGECTASCWETCTPPVDVGPWEPPP